MTDKLDKLQKKERMSGQGIPNEKVGQLKQETFGSPLTYSKLADPYKEILSIVVRGEILILSFLSIIALSWTGFYELILALLIIIYINLIPVCLFLCLKLLQFNELKTELVKKIISDPKVIIIISLFLSNWLISLVPQLILIPMYSPIILPLRPWAFLTSDIHQENIIVTTLRLGGIYIVLYCLFILISHGYKTIKSKSSIQKDSSPFSYWLELIVTILTISILGYEIFIPLFESLIPGISSVLFYPVITTFFTTPLTLVFLVYLLTGTFFTNEIVLNNHSHIKFRLSLCLFTILGYIILFQFRGLFSTAII
ncbi:MAG: hypothetical protein ACFFDT_01860 [Candidatus Hodarchaeota archaeon]